jgi:acyl-CoA thioester hydrolase
MASHTARVRVRYAETDQMGIVYHANYVVWMEVGRVELCRASGVAYRDIEKEGVHLAVIEANCRYIAPARYDDEIDIETSIVKSTPRGVEFGYLIRNAATGQLLAEGRTRHLFLGPELRPRKLPEQFHSQFGI